MLLEFSVKNFCTFKNEGALTMKPGKVMKRFEDNIVRVNRNLKVLKSAIIFGENAGGKTSFIRGLHYFKYLLESDEIARSLNGFTFHGIDPKQEFKIKVLVNKKIYTYLVEIDQYSPVKESLYIRNATQNSSKDRIVFKSSRSTMEKNEFEDEISVSVGMNISIADEVVDEELKKIIENRSKDLKSGLQLKFLNLIGVPVIAPFVEWINEKLLIEIPDDHSIHIYKKMRKNERDLEIMKKESFLEIFKLVDSSIVGIEIDDERPFEKSIVTREKTNGDYFRIEIEDESAGVQEFFAWATQIWKVIHENCTLFADEVDRMLNTILANRVTTYIKGLDHNGQFIFTTHNIMHMNTYDNMKEQLIFVTKNQDDFASEIYSLANFDEYRYDFPEVYKLYLKGILGGTPND